MRSLALLALAAGALVTVPGGTASAAVTTRCPAGSQLAAKAPLVASGGAGAPEHFVAAFQDADVDAALAASVFHSGAIAIPDLKRTLADAGIAVRPAA